MFLKFFSGHILYMKYPYGHLSMVELFKQNRRTEAVFHLYNRLIVPLNIKEICTLKYNVRFFMKDTPVLALKIIERWWTCISGPKFMIML